MRLAPWCTHLQFTADSLPAPLSLLRKRQVQAHRAMRTPAVLAPAALALATLGRAAGWLAHGRARLPRITKAQRAHTRCMNTSSTNHKTHMLAATMAQACISVSQARPHCRRTRDAFRASGQRSQHEHQGPRAYWPLHACKHASHWLDGRRQCNSSSSLSSDDGSRLRPGGTWHGPARRAGSRHGWLAAARPVFGASGSQLPPAFCDVTMTTTLRARPEPPRRTTEPPRCIQPTT